jgi:type II secretory pathway component PulF
MHDPQLDQPGDATRAVPAAGPMGPLTPEDLITLNEEIAGMARAGLPLDQGLAAIAREMGGGRLQRATAEIAADLHAGRTLPESLERQRGRVPEFYAGLVASGIRTGRLGEVLSTLTAYARAIADLRATVVGAVFYPTVILVFAFILFGFVCHFIIPQFKRIFLDFGIELPAITRFAIAIGDHPTEFYVFPPLAVLFTLAAAKFSLRSTSGGRRAWARFIYSMPIIGTLVRSARLAAFTDLLATLVDHSVPLAEAFRMAGQASSDPLMTEAAQQVEDDLRGGTSLGEALRNRRLVPELIAWMTGLGERRGNLAAALRQASQVYRRQVETRAQVLRTVLPPFLVMMTAAVLVAFFALAMFLPLVKLIAELSG